MADFGQELYETRTNLFSCENLIDYFWRRCSKNTYPFKPDNTSDIKTKAVSEEYLFGKDILERYNVPKEDLKNSGIHKNNEYHFDTCAFQTLNLEGMMITEGTLVLVYKPDRRYYSLFLVEDEPLFGKGLKLLMRVKQKVGLFGSFQNEMVTYY